jgi:hypothetical protein
MLSRWRRTVRQNPLASLQIAALLAVGVSLRFVNLGYSNLQGDEIKALCVPGSFKTVLQFLAFLLAQRKGPVEFVVACAVGLIDPSFSSELLLRLPFALANLLALACLFIVVWRLFSFEAAFYGTFLLATNGIFVAFGRFAQYQSFVLLGVSAALMGMIAAIRNDRWRVPGLYLASVATACALLAHFDAAFVLPPLALLTLIWWRKVRKLPNAGRMKGHLLTAGALFALLLLGFYVEYFIHVGAYQVDYWQTRLTGPATDTLRIALYYNPAPFVWFSLGAAGLALLRFRWTLGWQVLLAWLIPPLLFMEVIFKDSGTHAYTYILPLLLAAGLGLEGVVLWAKHRYGRYASQAARIIVLVILLLNAFASYSLLVDHGLEYPWRPKTILGVPMPGGSPMSTFGFSYNRSWRAIGDWFAALPSQHKIVVTNEKPLIASFYLPSTMRYQYRSSNPPDRPPRTSNLYFILVDYPQSRMGRLWGWTVAEWRERLTPAQTFYNAQGQPVAWIYVLNREQRAQFYP